MFDTLKDRLGLEQHDGRTLGRVFVRVAQRLLALAAVIWFNWQLGVADRRSLLATTTRPPTIQSESLI